MDDKLPPHTVPLRRRDFLRGALGVTMASALAPVRTQAAAESTYEPGYFSAAEWAFVHAAVDRLIPADGNGPGGVEAGVPVFLDRQRAATWLDCTADYADLLKGPPRGTLVADPPEPVRVGELA